MQYPASLSFYILHLKNFTAVNTFFLILFKEVCYIPADISGILLHTDTDVSWPRHRVSFRLIVNGGH